MKLKMQTTHKIESTPLSPHESPSEHLTQKANSLQSMLGNRIRHILGAPNTTSLKTFTLTSALAIITTLVFASIGFSEEASTTKTSEAGATSTRNRGAILDRNDKPLAIDDENGLRTYPTGKSTGNIVGYVGKTNRKDPIPSQGKSGVEKSGDAQLAKKEDVKLTIDADLQKHCYDLLAAQEHAGSVVVQDPLTGELLAMVSYPSFDPSLFIPAITSENYRMIRDDEKNPLLDKSINGSFAPGSVVKPLVALAGEFGGLNNPEIHCKDFMEFGRTKIHDWNPKRDELLRIPEALATSCNTYFMELAIRTGEESLNQIGEIFHLNEAPLTSLTSSRGNWNQVPKGEDVSRTSLALTSLGQGRTLLSPLHVSTMTSAIASGTWHQPFLIQGQTPSKPSTPLIGQGQITADSLNTIREGMRLSIHGKRGTAQRATIPGINLAGKTGTAQFKRSYPTTNCWFTGYGPYEEPEYAVTVLLSGATSGGKNAAPVAKEVFDYLLSEKEAKQVQTPAFREKVARSVVNAVAAVEMKGAVQINIKTFTETETEKGKGKLSITADKVLWSKDKRSGVYSGDVKITDEGANLAAQPTLTVPNGQKASFSTGTVDNGKDDTFKATFNPILLPNGDINLEYSILDGKPVAETLTPGDDVLMIQHQYLGGEAMSVITLSKSNKGG